MAIERHTYSNGEVAILWQPKLCVHCGNCARGLPQVFRPKERPWITLEGADADEVRAQVAKCPSGALSLTETGD